MLALASQVGVDCSLERSQQVAVAERLKKREPSQLAPGMVFFIGHYPLIDVLLRRSEPPSYVCRIDRRIIFPNLVYALY